MCSLCSDVVMLSANTQNLGRSKVFLLPVGVTNLGVVSTTVLADGVGRLSGMGWPLAESRVVLSRQTT